MSIALKILQFIVSPAGMALMIVAFLIVPLFVLWPWQSRKRAARILAYFHASISYPLSTITFSYWGRLIQLQSTTSGRGRGTSSFPTLQFDVSMNKQFFFGHPHCFNYTLVGFWRIPKSAVTNGGLSALIGADDPQLLDRLQQVLTEHPLPQDLLLNEYSCLRAQSRRGRGVARYWGVHKDATACSVEVAPAPVFPKWNSHTEGCSLRTRQGFPRLPADLVLVR